MTQIDFNEILRKINAAKEEEIKKEIVENIKKQNEEKKEKEDKYDIAMANFDKKTENYENLHEIYNNENISSLYNYKKVNPPEPLNIRKELKSFFDNKIATLTFSSGTGASEGDTPEENEIEEEEEKEKTNWIEDLIYGFFDVVITAIKFIIGELIGIIKFIINDIIGNVFKGVKESIIFGIKHMGLAILLFFSIMCIYRFLHFSRKFLIGFNM